MEQIARGETGEVLLQVRNAGELASEEVTLEVETTSPAVDLLNERGVPHRKRSFSLGSLAPKATSPRQRLALLARQSAPLGHSSLKITIYQKDLPPLRQSIDFKVIEGQVSFIPIASSAAPPPPTRVRSASTSPATISFLRYTEGQISTSEAVGLRFEVQSPGEPAEVRLTQNGRTLPLDSFQQRGGSNGELQVFQYEALARLDEGNNAFEVVVITEAGIRNSRTLNLIRELEGGKLWVVAIGVSDYADRTIKDLQYAEADARAVHDHFKENLKLPDNQLFLLTGEEATLRNIKSTLGTQLAKQASSNRDTIVLYFAGHGDRDRVVDNRDADGLAKYLLPYDATRADLYSTALDMDEITRIFRRLIPERIVVILDSCFSGAAGGRSPFTTGRGERSILTGEFLDRMAREGRGHIILTASGPNESAREDSTFGHGVFTHFLLEGLRGKADTDRDGQIDADEVFRYTSEKVTRFTQGEQHPERKAPESVGRILLGQSPIHPPVPK